MKEPPATARTGPRRLDSLPELAVNLPFRYFASVDGTKGHTGTFGAANLLPCLQSNAVSQRNKLRNPPPR